jgi:hypothetical protein
MSGKQCAPGQHAAAYRQIGCSRTFFHMVKEESGIEGNTGPVYRERAVYRVRCKALLIDLSGKEIDFPDLVGPDYGFTQQIGERLHREGHPGLLAPSVRHRGGINLVALTPAILSDPKLFCYLTYTCDPTRRCVTVERTVGKVMSVLKFRSSGPLDDKIFSPRH